MNDTSGNWFPIGRKLKPFSTEFALALRQMAEFLNEVRTWWPAILGKVKEPRAMFASGVASGTAETWALLNATYSGSFTTGVAPTDLGDGIFEYKAVPVKITGYAGGTFTYAIADDPRFAPSAYSGTSVTVLNPPTHENDADWKYAGVSTGAGSDYPAGYDIRGIGEDRVAGTWHSVLVRIEKLTIDAETTLWLFMAEPDHDSSCTDGGGGGGASEATILAIGAMRA